MNKKDTQATLKKMEEILLNKYVNISYGWADSEYEKIEEDPWNSLKASEHISSLISEYYDDLGKRIKRPTVPES